MLPPTTVSTPALYTAWAATYDHDSNVLQPPVSTAGFRTAEGGKVVGERAGIGPDGRRWTLLVHEEDEEVHRLGEDACLAGGHVPTGVGSMISVACIFFYFFCLSKKKKKKIYGSIVHTTIRAARPLLLPPAQRLDSRLVGQQTGAPPESRRDARRRWIPLQTQHEVDVREHGGVDESRCARAKEPLVVAQYLLERAPGCTGVRVDLVHDQHAAAGALQLRLGGGTHAPRQQRVDQRDARRAVHLHRQSAVPRREVQRVQLGPQNTSTQLHRKEGGGEKKKKKRKKETRERERETTQASRTRESTSSSTALASGSSGTRPDPPAHSWILLAGRTRPPSSPGRSRNGSCPDGDAWLLDATFVYATPQNLRYVCFFWIFLQPALAPLRPAGSGKRSGREREGGEKDRGGGGGGETCLPL